MDALIKKGTNVEFTLSGNTGTVTAIGNKTVSITKSKGENFKLPHAEVNRMVDAKSLKKI